MFACPSVLICGTSPSSPTSITAKPRWSMPCSGSQERFESVRLSKRGDGLHGSGAGKAASPSSPRTPPYGTTRPTVPWSPSTSSTRRGTPISVARLSVASRWSMVCCCWWTLLRSAPPDALQAPQGAGEEAAHRRRDQQSRPAGCPNCRGGGRDIRTFLDLLDEDSSGGLDFPVVYASAKADVHRSHRPATAKCPTARIWLRCLPRFCSTSRRPAISRERRCRPM